MTTSPRSRQRQCFNLFKNINSKCVALKYFSYDRKNVELTVKLQAGSTTKNAHINAAWRWTMAQTSTAVPSLTDLGSLNKPPHVCLHPPQGKTVGCTLGRSADRRQVNLADPRQLYPMCKVREFTPPHCFPWGIVTPMPVQQKNFVIHARLRRTHQVRFHTKVPLWGRAASHVAFLTPPSFR